MRPPGVVNRSHKGSSHYEVLFFPQRERKRDGIKGGGLGSETKKDNQGSLVKCPLTLGGGCLRRKGWDTVNPTKRRRQEIC